MASIALTRLSKSYNQSRQVLNQISVQLEPGQLCLLYGRSGSGKTTLLKCLSGVETPDQGMISVLGKHLFELSESKRADFRLANIGMIYQFFNLLPSLSVRENILLPANLLKMSHDDYLISLASTFGITHILDQWPETLSGGELQRAAICRALICKPKIILADEPTGNLDIENRDIVMTHLKSLVNAHDLSIIIATHDQELVPYADTVWRLRNGAISID